MKYIKDIKGYEGYYKITKDGDVFSIRSNRFLKLNYKKNGYVYIELNVDGVAKTHRVHRLVAEVFIPNPENKPFVNHKDGVKSNNHIENLEWVTGTENNLHAIRNKLAIPQCNTYEVTNHNYKTLKMCCGFKEVEEHTGLKSSQICNLLDKNKPSRKGYYIKSIERSTTSA